MPLQDDNKPAVGSMSLDSLLSSSPEPTSASTPAPKAIPTENQVQPESKPEPVPQTGSISEAASLLNDDSLDLNELGAQTESIPEVHEPMINQIPPKPAVQEASPAVAPPVSAPSFAPPSTPVASNPAPASFPSSAPSMPPSAMGDAPMPPAAGFQVASLGTKVSRYPINRFRIAAGSSRRVAALFDIDANGNPLLPIVKTHYKEGIGHFYCFNGKCCEEGGLPNLRYIIPVVVYDTDKHGKIVSPDYEIEYLQLGEDKYMALMGLHENVNLQTIDLLASLDGEEKYQKLNLQNIGPASWLTDEGFKNSVWSKFQEVFPKIGMVIARTITPERYEEMGMIGASSSVAQPRQNQSLGSNSISSFLKK